jgi:hypothetical protein
MYLILSVLYFKVYMQYLALTGNGILPDLKLGGVSSILVILKRE